MRLTRLALRRYGNFDETSLSFDPAPGRINLVLAPNGAGKSVLRGAFGDLLFGIGAQTPMGFRHGYAGMQILAEGIGPDGAPFSLIRRKGRNNTLVDADEQPLEGAALARLLGATDRTLLERLFALDTERLRAGGQGLLASGGALAEALLEAAGGLRQAQALRQDLESERDKLAPRRKLAQRPFYSAMERLTASRRRLREKLVRPDAWKAREETAAAARQGREAARQAANEAAQTLRRLERLRRIRPLLAQHDMALDWLRDHSEAPRLPPDLGARLAAARREAERRAELLRGAQERHAALLEQAALVRPDRQVLDHGPAIQALLELAGVAGKARQDLPAVEAALREAEAQVERQMRALALPGTAADAADRLPHRAVLDRWRRLAEAHGRLAEDQATWPGRIAFHEAALRQASEALDQLPPAEDAEGLAGLVTAITAEGDPARLWAEAQRHSAQAGAQLEAQLARLPGSLRDPAKLRALVPPDASRLKRLAEERDAGQAALRAEDAGQARLAAALAQTRGERAALEREGALPDAAALARARQRRDAGWNLIYRRAFSGEAPDMAAEQAFAEGEPLALAYARAVTEADAIADQRHAETARLARAGELDRAITQQAAALAEAEAKRAAAAGRAAGAEAAWAAAVAPLGLGPEAGWPDAAALLARRDAAIEAAQVAESATARLREVERRQEADRQRLLQALERADTGTTDLRALLDMAEARQRDQRQAATRRATLLAERNATERALAEARRAAAEAASRFTEWRGEWQDLLLSLERDPAERPEESLVVLRLLDELVPLVGTCGELGRGAETMRAQIAAFGAACGTTWRLLGGSGDPDDAFAAARAMGERMRREEAAATRLQLLRQQAEAAGQAVAAAEDAAAEALAGLRGTLAEAGAAEPQVAEDRIALSLERRRHEALRDETLRDLLTAGDGLPLPSLRAEAQELGALDLDAALEEARQALEAQQSRIAEAAAEAARLEAELEALHRDDGLAQAVQDQQSAMAQLGRTLEDALLMQVAASLLGTALASVQDAGDDTLLRRIGQVFSELTEGTYPAVFSRENDKGVAHLVLRHRDFPEEETLVDALSEGTRDQLFLALRLVAIEDHAAGGGALPFMGDDVLQSFDDRRAAAAFRALLGLSRTTQVILLSHHEHLADLARAALPEGALHLQRMGWAA